MEFFILDIEKVHDLPEPDIHSRTITPIHPSNVVGSLLFARPI